MYMSQEVGCPFSEVITSQLAASYHSAKGLQFDIVIIPMFDGANNEETRKALYVAMTRTMHQLYLMYNTPNLASPLDKVPPRLYKKN